MIRRLLNLLIVCLSLSAFAQTTPIVESFANLGPYGGYQTESWVGDDGGTWTATDSRTDQSISGKAITIRNGVLTSPSINGGAGTITLTTQRKFGSSGSGNLSLSINGTQIGTVPYNGNVQTTNITANVPGSFVLSISTPSNGDRIAIDDLNITAYSGSGNQPPQIINITQSPTSGNVTSVDAVSVSADVTDSDGVASVVLSWGTTSGSLSNTISMSLDSGNTYTTNTDIPAQADGTTIYYEIEAMDNAVEISTSSEQNYSVFDPINLIISEVGDPGDFYQARFVEVYNNGSSAIDFSSTTVYLARYANGSSAPQTVQLAGTLSAGDYYVIASNNSDFSSAFGFSADLESGIVTGNGDDVYALYVNGDESSGSLLDIYGEIGIDGTGEAWEYVDSRAVRNSLSYSPSSTWIASQWDIFSADVSDMTPGRGEPTVYTYNNAWSPANPVGNATASDEVLIQNGQVTLSSGLEVFHLEVEAAGELLIEGILKINGNITNNGSITFISNATTTGQLDEFYGTISGNDITVERFIPGDAVDGVRAFRFLTSAVTTSTSINANWQEGVNNTTTNFSNNQNPDPGFGIHITGSTTGANGFDATPSGNPSLFGFDNQYTDANQAWYDVANTNVNTLTAGEPYRVYVRGNRGIDVTDNGSTPTTPAVIRATGDLATGNQTSALGNTQDHFNFIGNPYQAIVDINSVLANSTNLNTNQYYVWDPNMNTQGAYVTVDLSTGNPTPSASEANQFLQPGQAAFVTTLANGASSVLFQESDKATSEAFTEVFRGANQATISTINIDLQTQEAYANNGKLADGVLLKFSSNASNMIEADDATKLGNLDETLSVVNNNHYLSIESRALPQAGEEVPFYLNQYRHQAYVFRIYLNEVSGVTAYLVDDYLGTQTEMINNQENIYSFNVDEAQPGSIDPERFSIAFAEENLGISNLTKNTFTIYPNPSAAGEFTLQLAQLNSNEVKLNIFNMLGKQVYQNQFSAEAQIRVRNTGLEAGIYLIQVEIDGKTSTQKLIVK